MPNNQNWLPNNGSLTKPIRRTLVSGSVARLLVGSCVGLSFLAQARAQHTTSDEPDDIGEQIDEVSVIEQGDRRYLINQTSLSKLTQNLQDTPQSIDVLTSDMLDDRASLSVNDALRNVPGITLGAGEFSWQGNNPNIRGFNARDDMYLDGIRDFGSYPRDPFSIEQLEVLLGPSSVLFGRGSAGGAINQASKRAKLESFSKLSLNLGSDETVRGTVDIGRPLSMLGEGVAFRLNALGHSSEVADRAGAKTRRFGIAPSVSFGLNTSTLLSVNYLMQVSDDRPDYGIPWLNGQPADVPRQNFYGFNSDYLETDVNVFTLEVSHEINDHADISAVARYAQYSRESRITEPLVLDAVPIGSSLQDVSVFRYVFIGESDESLLTGQINTNVRWETGNVSHSLAAGMEFSEETSKPVFAFGIDAPTTDLLNPTPSDLFTATNTDPRIVANTIGRTSAAYVIDTLTFNEQWQLTIGGRWDRFATDYNAERFSGPPTPFNPGEDSGAEAFDQVDTVFSYRTAVVYKPTIDLSAYLAASTAFNPSAQSLSFLTSGRGLGTGNVSLEPEENRSIELGLKASLREGAASVALALFQTEKINARIPDPDNPGFNTLGGKQRIRGASINAAGMITSRISVSAGYVYLDSKLIKGAAGVDAGGRLANAPEHSLSAWAEYRLSDRFDVGVGARYVSDQFAIIAAKQVPSYKYFDAMLRYQVSDSASVKLNLTNIGDTYYYDQLHPWHVVPASGFTAVLALNLVY